MSPSYDAIDQASSTNVTRSPPMTGMEWAEVEPRSENGIYNDEDGCTGQWKPIVLVTSLLVLLGTSGWWYWNQLPAAIPLIPGSTSSSVSLPMPDGVNVGSWLSLEDYFFAGGSAVEVATPDGDTAAVCLPPLHTGQATGPTWHSETDLLENLITRTSLSHALQVFHAHRTSFLDLEEDLATLARLGVRSLRIPISWCLTDENPAEMDPSDEDLESKFTCRDPFYENVLWPAVPRSLLVHLLDACAQHGMKATLDMHTYPGATSPGTFSGVWPRWPRFWTHGDQPATNDGAHDIGRTLWKDMVLWVESLEDETLRGLQALSPMNEPAHLAGMLSQGNGENGPFLPPLPKDMAKAYSTKLQATNPDGLLTFVPDGPHLRVLKWLDDAVDVFRTSSLPDRGIQLAVNVIESVLHPKVLPPNDGEDPGGRDPGAMHVLAAWWRGATLPAERTSWAVLDVHHYHAWGPQCQGASDGHLVANYTCSNVEERTKALLRCASWAALFRQAVDKECGPGALLMSGEMSASTHHSVRHACNDLSTLRASYRTQVEAAKQAKVNLYWWSYKMPYGGAFRPAWSFKHFLYLMGVLPRPDDSNYGCGDHVPIENEPNDDIFKDSEL